MLAPSNSRLPRSLLSKLQAVHVCEWASFLCQPKLSSEDKSAGLSCCSKAGQANSLLLCCKIRHCWGLRLTPGPAFVLGKLPKSAQVTPVRYSMSLRDVSLISAFLLQQHYHCDYVLVFPPFISGPAQLHVRQGWEWLLLRVCTYPRKAQNPHRCPFGTLELE